MSSSIYQALLAKAERTRTAAMQTVARARNWFRSSAMLIRGVNVNKVMREDPSLLRQSKQVTVSDFGQMFMFFYDPKHKKTLPYYDRLPLVFIVELYPDGFLGINLHYLPPRFRARLMDQIYQILKQTENDSKKRNRMTYRVLKAHSKYGLYKPCVHRYLYSHIRSKLRSVPQQEWDMTLMLPLERFEKASKNSIFEKSLQQVGV